MEIYNDDKNALYNQIKYFTYDDKKQELDLTLCKDIETKIYYSIKSSLDESALKDFSKLGIDILNIKDEFFNDICYPYSDSNKDMILEDRIKYIYQNYSLCEEGCTYNNIDIENMNVVCNCKIQGNFSLIITPLIFDHAKDISIFDSNIGVIKCFNLVFSFNNKFKNIGFIFFLILMLIYLFLLFFFLFKMKGIKPIKNYLLNEMEKNGYIVNNDKINKKKKKKSKSIIMTNNGGILSIKKNIINGEEIKGKRNGDSAISNINIMQTSKDNYISDEIDESNNYGIIKINLNVNIKEYFPKDSYKSLHNYTFDEAIKYDKRNIFRIFYIYLLSKQIIFHTFLSRNPLELFPLRFNLFIFMLSCDLALNALFYSNDNISKKYEYAKNLFLFTFSNNITIIIYSTLLSFVIITLMTKLTNSANAIRNVFRKEEQKLKDKKNYKITKQIKKGILSKISNILKRLKIKIFCLCFIQIILILFFWYFITAFCHVYSNTQTSWLLDTFLSILSRFIIELIFAFLYGKLYQIAVGSNIETLYNIVMCIYDFG